MPNETAPAPASTPKPSTRAPKARPRAGVHRRTKEEREQFAKEEAERQKARAAEEGRNEGLKARGGKAARGGRGAATAGQRDERAKEGGGGGVGGGVFGAGSGMRPGWKPRGSTGEGYSEMLGNADLGESLQRDDTGRGDFSTGGRAGASRRTDAVDIGTDDDEPDEPKRSIERIWISSDEDDDIVVPNKGKQKASRRLPRVGMGLRPVRAPRTRREAEEETGEMHKTTGSAKKVDSELQDQENDDGLDADDHVHFVKEQPSSPEMRRRSLKKPSGKATKEVKFATTETAEERAERLRVADDVQKLRQIFGTEPGQQRSIHAAGDAEDSKESINDIENGKLFLFQLPPLTPFLVDPSSKTDELGVKQEPAGEASETIPPTTIPHADPAKTNPEMKKDLDASATEKPDLQVEGLLTASEPRRLPCGLVGKLRVHKSGKVSLDWGGTDMEVRHGSEVSFLQDIVLVQPGLKKEADEAGGDQEADAVSPLGGDGLGADSDRKKAVGTAFALGQVNSKMVLTPDWAKLYD